jgi:hypothetical protein
MEIAFAFLPRWSQVVRGAVIFGLNTSVFASRKVLGLLYFLTPSSTHT